VSESEGEGATVPGLRRADDGVALPDEGRHRPQRPHPSEQETQREQQTQRAVPYACPFCGEEDLRPTEDGPWHCRSCLRLFSVTFHGLAAPETSDLPSTRPPDLE
jgi:ribosomal protein L37AE/L43A